jgi:succinoglycan biosynthesis protein ExoM
LVSSKPHICVCLCTYKRPHLLPELLSALEKQDTHGRFGHSIVVVDNDAKESAREIVESFARQAGIPVQYHVEAVQSIALARNRSVACASGEFAAFVDDDEIPIGEWLYRMHSTLEEYRVDGVFGPVEPVFATKPPIWMVKAGLFDRPTYERTGSRISWRRSGMGNVLVRRSVLDALSGPFDPAFGSGGEDVDFFRRAMDAGKVFVWCGEATVHETVPAERTRLWFQVRRALLRGEASARGRAGTGLGIMKSMAATGVYTVALPFLLLGGRHVLVKYAIKDLDHIGRLLGACGVSVVRDKYVTE